jgi:hypothetical protein
MKNFNIKVLILWLSMMALGAICSARFGDPAKDAFANLRFPLFTGMLALAGFLFTSRATWLARLRESYEAAEHIDNVKELRDRGVRVEYYGGFSRLASALNLLTFITCFSGIAQLTIGLWNSALARGACIGAAVGAIIIFLYLLYRIRRVEAFWIRKLEQEQELKQRHTSRTQAAELQH